MKTIFLGIIISLLGLSSFVTIRPSQNSLLVDRYKYWGFQNKSNSHHIRDEIDFHIEKFTTRAGKYPKPMFLLMFMNDGKRLELARSGSERKMKRWQHTLIDYYNYNGNRFTLVHFPLSPLLAAGLFVIILGIGLLKGFVKGP